LFRISTKAATAPKDVAMRRMVTAIKTKRIFSFIAAALGVRAYGFE
jgi:hypothetical protein